MSALFVLARKQTIWSLRRRGQEGHSGRTAHLICNAFTGRNALVARLVYFVLNGFIRQSQF